MIEHIRQQEHAERLRAKRDEAKRKKYIRSQRRKIGKWSIAVSNIRFRLRN